MNESQLNSIRDYLFTVIIQNNFLSIAQPLITFNNLIGWFKSNMSKYKPNKNYHLLKYVKCSI